MPFFVTFLALLASLGLGYIATTGAPTILIVLTLGAVVTTLAFLYPKGAITLLVFSMLLSPKLGMGAVSSARDVVLRYDDILLVVMFFSWFAKTAIFKDKPFITATPLQTPILLYTFVYIASTSLGIMRGSLDMKASLFYLLKYIEYFLLYFMTVNIVESKEEMKKYLAYGWIVAVVVTIYAFYFYLNASVDARTSAPFEAPLNSTLKTAEPASLGGYYLVVFGVLLGLITEYSGYILTLAIASLAFMFPAFLLTFSRSSYIGFTILVLTLIFFANRRKLFIFMTLAIGISLVALLPGVATKVFSRIAYTYSGEDAVNKVRVGGLGEVRLEGSAAARVASMKYVIFQKLPYHPVFGMGVTGIGLGDTQYALILGEAGIAGLAVFVWLIVTAFRTAKTVYAGYSEPWIKALSLGFIASLAGLLFQAVGVNSFIIIRIMEPFWFIAALLSVLYRDLQSGAAGQEQRVKG